MKRAVFVVIGLAGWVAAPSFAQGSMDVPTMNPSQTRTSPQSGETALDQLTNLGANPAEKFNNYMLRQRLKKSQGKSIKELLAEDKAAAEAIVAAAKLSCTVTNAILIAEGGDQAGGATISTKTYEISCGSGMGYFLVKREPLGQPSGFSCFAAEAARAADVAAGRQPAVVCGLPENGNSKAMAAAVLNGAGKQCVVRDTKWLGQSAKSNTDYVEVACQDGTGFVVAAPLPGSTLSIRVAPCPDSARQGVPCSLSGNGVSMQSFKDALTQRGVSCDASDMRLVGRESIKRRHVVEFLCPQQHPKGLVAFIPLEDGAAPFETVDCTNASKRGVSCTLTKPQ